jgi:hypothetical protein
MQVKLFSAMPDISETDTIVNMAATVGMILNMSGS